MIALLGLAGCGASDEPAPPDGPSHLLPRLGGPYGDLFVDQVSGEFTVSWYEGCETPLDPCHQDSFVFDQIDCTDCSVETVTDRWVPAQGVEIFQGTAAMRLTAHSAGAQSLTFVLRSTEHPDHPYVETLSTTFQVSSAP